MKRTLEIMQKKLDKIDSEIASLELKRGELFIEKNKIENEIAKYRIEHGLFYSMDELKNYKGKDIHRIKLINKDTLKVEIIDVSYDGTFEVDSDGHLQLFSWSKGNIKYNPRIEKYEYWLIGNCEVKDYIGYTDIVFVD